MIGATWDDATAHFIIPDRTAFDPKKLRLTFTRLAIDDNQTTHFNEAALIEDLYYDGHLIEGTSVLDDPEGSAHQF